jgi:putative endonuclease
VIGSNPVFSTKLKSIGLSFFILKPMFYTYIIFSKTLDKYYTGSCENIETRLNDHLNSRSTYTKTAKDWIMVYFETFDSRSLAVKREMEIKKKKSRKYIEFLISSSSID